MKTHIWVGDGILSLDGVGLEKRMKERDSQLGLWQDLSLSATGDPA